MEAQHEKENNIEKILQKVSKALNVISLITLIPYFIIVMLFSGMGFDSPDIKFQALTFVSMFLTSIVYPAGVIISVEKSRRMRRNQRSSQAVVISMIPVVLAIITILFLNSVLPVKIL